MQEGKNTSFELASNNLGMAPEAVRAGKLLDAALENQNMSVDETGYFNILVNVFSQVGHKVHSRGGRSKILQMPDLKGCLYGLLTNTYF